MSEAWQYDDPMEFWEDRGSVRSERMVELRKRNAFNQFAEIPEVSDLVEALQAEGYAVMECARVRYCPFCGRLRERANPDDEMCLPTNCDAWTYTRRFNHETREWEPVVPLGEDA